MNRRKKSSRRQPKLKIRVGRRRLQAALDPAPRTDVQPGFFPLAWPL